MSAYRPYARLLQDMPPQNNIVIKQFIVILEKIWIRFELKQILILKAHMYVQTILTITNGKCDSIRRWFVNKHTVGGVPN